MQHSLLFHSSWRKLIGEQQFSENIKTSKCTNPLNWGNCTSPQYISLFGWWQHRLNFTWQGLDRRQWSTLASNSRWPILHDLCWDFALSLCLFQIFKEICLCTKLETAKSSNLWCPGHFFWFNYIVLLKEITHASKLAFKFHLGNVAMNFPLDIWSECRESSKFLFPCISNLMLLPCSVSASYTDVCISGIHCSS